ncbi:MAG: autotransporter-associated beta strand repeat-containing protein, partial [Rhabdochlamydiaceae bacterium]|nr:autotransporter-associated beta strand repeat-containing protein [Rhabdochlamydiaceae bacterium]
MSWEKYVKKSLVISSLACFTLGQNALDAACSVSNGAQYNAALGSPASCSSEMRLTSGFALTTNATSLTTAVGTSLNPFVIDGDGLSGPYTINGGGNRILDIRPAAGSTYVSLGSTNSAADVLFSNGSVRISGGGGSATLQMNNASGWAGISTITIESLGTSDFAVAGTFSGGVVFQATTSTVQADAALVLNGALSGSGSFIKTGTGTVTITNGGFGANTYSGGTDISEGAINIQFNQALGTGAVAVSSSGQLQLQGGITVTNLLSLNGTGTGSGALVNESGTNTASGAITLQSATTIGSSSGTLNLDAISG